MRVIDALTCELQAQYDESVKSADGSALTDLQNSSIYYKIGTLPPVKVAQVPASKLTGGGHITQLVVVPAPSGVATTFDFYVTETDLKGNEGPASNHVVITIDRVGPDAPLNFTIA